MTKRWLRRLLHQVLPPRRRTDGARRLTVEEFESRTLPSTLAPLTTFNPGLPPSASAGGASQALVSADGRYVVYASTAPNVLPGQVDTAVVSNIFRYDQQTGITTLVSHTPGSATTGADGFSDTPRISGDGRFVVYESSADDLVAGQAGLRGLENVFLYDASTGTNTLVSHRFDSPTTAADDYSQTFQSTGFGFGPSTGRFLLFSSYATDLLAGQGGPITVNLFLYDTTTGTTSLVSHTPSSPLTGCDDETFQADLTPDGRFVVFDSQATDEVPGQTGGRENIFLYDTAAGTTRLVSGSFAGSGNSPTNGVGSSFEPRISADGRILTYTSYAGNLVSGQTTGGAENVYAYDTSLARTTLVSHASGLPATPANRNSPEAVVSSDGSTVAFLSFATNLTPGQGGNTGNAFLYDTATGAVTLVSHLPGASAVAAGNIDGDPGTFEDLSLSARGDFLCYRGTAGNLAAGQSGPAGTEKIFLYARQSGQNTLVSRVNGTAAAAGNNDSFFGFLGADGSTLAFVSGSTNLVPGVAVADGGQDLFLYAVTAGTGPTLASRSAFQATATSLVAGTSADGRFVIFTSNATDVVPGQVDGNFDQDVFLLDRTTGTTALVSHVPGSATTAGGFGSPDTSNSGAVGPSLTPVLSADGNWVAFDSSAADLVPGRSGYTNQQIFLFNRLTGAVTLVSHDASSPTAFANDGAFGPVLSADGRYLAYWSFASDLVPGFVPYNPNSDTPNVYLYDTTTGTTTLVSHAAGLPQNGCGALGASVPVISADGRFVAYYSGSTNLVAGGNIYPTHNVYLFDRTTGTNALVSHVPGSPTTSPAPNSEGPVLSADGSTVAFVSFATDLVPGQRPAPFANVFLYDVATGTVRLASGANGSPTQPAGGYSDSPVLSADGSRVAFRSDAPDVVGGQVNTPGSTSNVFLLDRRAGTVTLVSHAAGAATTTAPGDSSNPDLDGAGDLVVYLSTAADLVPGQVNPAQPVNNVFLYSVALHANALVSGQGGSTTAASPVPAFQAILSQDPVVVFNASGVLFPGGGGTSVAYVNDLVKVLLSPNTVAAGLPAGGAVGYVSVDSVFVGQYLAPAYRLVAGAASNGLFALAGAAGGQALLLTQYQAGTTALQSYGIYVDVDTGFGHYGAYLSVFSPAPGSAPPPSPIVARVVPVRVRKKVRLMVQVLFANTGAVISSFFPPYQLPGYRRLTATVSGGRVVVTATKHGRRLTRIYPV